MNQLEEAFQRQVIFRGTLDTNILEMGILWPARIQQLLCDAKGLPGPSKNHIESPDPALAGLLSAGQAESSAMVPVARDANGLHVLVTDDIDPASLELLRRRASADVLPYITLEFRFHHALERIYGTKAPRRFTRLLERFGLVDPETEVIPGAMEAQDAPVEDEVQSAEPDVEGFLDPLSLPQALADLGLAQDRDQVIDTILSFTLARLQFAAVFVVRSDRVDCWRTMGDSVDVPPQEISVSFYVHSLIRTLVDEGGQLLGSIPPTDPFFMAIEALGRSRSWNLVLLPVSVGRRPVLLIMGDKGLDPVTADDVAHLVQIINPAQEALLRLIKRARSQKAQPQVTPPQKEALAPQPQITPPQREVLPAPRKSPIRWPSPSEPPKPADPPPPQEPLSLPDLDWSTVQDADPPGDDIVPPPPLVDAGPLEGALPSPPRLDEEVGELSSLKGNLRSILQSRRPGLDRAAEPAPAEPVRAEEEALEDDRSDAWSVEATAKGWELMTQMEGSCPPDAGPEEDPIPVEPPPPDDALAERWESMASDQDVGEAGEPFPEEPMDVSLDISLEDLSGGNKDVSLDISLEDLPGESKDINLEELSEGKGEDLAIDVDITSMEDRPPQGISPLWPPARPVAQRPSEAEMASLLDQLESPDMVTSRAAADRLLEIGEPALSLLIADFPGTLKFEWRNMLKDRWPPVFEHSNLLRCLSRFGKAVAPRMLPLLASPDLDVRFYATYLFSALPFPEMVEPLTERLYDEDHRVRAVAVAVIRRFHHHPEYEEGLRRLRQDLEALDEERQVLACEILSALRDQNAVPRLVDLLSHDSQAVAKAAQEALKVITRQDFGARERKWERWWEENKDKTRVEWLIASLEHKSLELRIVAFEELTALTHETFDYLPDASRRQRERSLEEWRGWWQTMGKRIHRRESRE